jgi:hypothetical protein
MTFTVVGTKQAFVASVLYSEKQKKVVIVLQVLSDLGYAETYNTALYCRCSETCSVLLY